MLAVCNIAAGQDETAQRRRNERCALSSQRATGKEESLSHLVDVRFSAALGAPGVDRSVTGQLSREDFSRERQPYCVRQPVAAALGSRSTVL